MRDDYVRVRVHGIAADGGEGMPAVLLLDEEGESGVSVPVGPFEASAIIVELEGIVPPRPLTHDLLAGFFGEGGLSLSGAFLFGPGEGSPRALLRYRRGLFRREKEVRPSDAIALALRLKAPIQVERCLMNARDRVGMASAFCGEGGDQAYLKAPPQGRAAYGAR